MQAFAVTEEEMASWVGEMNRLQQGGWCLRVRFVVPSQGWLWGGDGELAIGTFWPIADLHKQG